MTSLSLSHATPALCLIARFSPAAIPPAVITRLAQKFALEFLKNHTRRQDGARSDGVRHDRARDGAWRKASLIRNGEHTKARGWRGKESA